MDAYLKRLKTIVMARSFTQLYIHSVFAVKYRKAQIDIRWEDELFSVMGGALKELGHCPIIINGTEDHVHALWRHNRTKTLPETMKAMKGGSSHWINKREPGAELFRWQGGYGAFTVSVDRVPKVKNYIARQKIHHRSLSISQEYKSLLNAHGEYEAEDFMFAALE